MALFGSQDGCIHYVKNNEINYLKREKEKRRYKALHIKAVR